MKINYIEGNLIEMFKEGKINIIAHQCNCFHLGAGIAGQLIKEFPQLQIPNYKSGINLYGSVDYFDTEYGGIINLYSQFMGGGCDPTGIDSFATRKTMLKKCIISFNETLTTFIKEGKSFKFAIPLIASGIAADPERKKGKSDLEYFNKYILPIFEQHLTIPELNVVIYK